MEGAEASGGGGLASRDGPEDSYSVEKIGYLMNRKH